MKKILRVGAVVVAGFASMGNAFAQGNPFQVISTPCMFAYPKKLDSASYHPPSSNDLCKIYCGTASEMPNQPGMPSFCLGPKLEDGYQDNHLNYAKYTEISYPGVLANFKQRMLASDYGCQENEITVDTSCPKPS